MKEVTLTCPFTGLDFTALQDADGNLHVKHALTGQMLKVNWNKSVKRYNMVKDSFKRIETVNVSEAMEILEVSKQRMSQIMLNGMIPVFTINGKARMILADVLEYRDNRKIGRPKKDD